MIQKPNSNSKTSEKWKLVFLLKLFTNMQTEFILIALLWQGEEILNIINAINWMQIRQ